MAAALRQLGLPVAMQSERDLKADSPRYAWLTALCTIMADPLNAYEIVGVLREIFGVSITTSRSSPRRQEPFPHRCREAATGRVSSHLRALAETRQKADGRALFDAISPMVRETQLRRRLNFPAEEFGDLGTNSMSFSLKPRKQKRAA